MKKPEKFLYMTPDDARRFVAHSYKFNAQIGLMFDITFNGGFRISETLNICISDIDFPKNVIHIKTLKQKIVMEKAEVLMPERLIRLCRQFIEFHALKSSDRLFPFTRQWAWQCFKKILRICKMNHLYSTHALRHAHGIMVSNATRGDLVKIAKRLRHSSVKSAWKYVHLSMVDQKEIINYMEKEGMKKNDKSSSL